MADTSTDNSGAKGPPNWFIKTCKWLWKKQGFIWSSVALGITLNMLATLFFIQWPLANNKNLDGTIIQWLLQDPGVVLIVGIFMLLLILIIYLGSRFDVTVIVPDKNPREIVVNREQEAKRRYLQRMIRENENLTLKGIPAGLMAQGVPLDEVFIPLQFKPHRPPSDYPLTIEELRVIRDHLQSGTLSDGTYPF